jgi:hypothetical protein
MSAKPLRTDHVLMQVTLTLAVETYVCHDHAEQAFESAQEAVLERLINQTDTEIIVMGAEFTPLTLTKQVRS